MKKKNKKVVLGTTHNAIIFEKLNDINVYGLDRKMITRLAANSLSDFLTKFDLNVRENSVYITAKKYHSDGDIIKVTLNFGRIYRLRHNAVASISFFFCEKEHILTLPIIPNVDCFLNDVHKDHPGVVEFFKLFLQGIKM